MKHEIARIIAPLCHKNTDNTLYPQRKVNLQLACSTELLLQQASVLLDVIPRKMQDLYGPLSSFLPCSPLIWSLEKFVCREESEVTETVKSLWRIWRNMSLISILCPSLSLNIHCCLRAIFYLIAIPGEVGRVPSNKSFLGFSTRKGGTGRSYFLR